MQSHIRIPGPTQELLCCPTCRAKLRYGGEQFICMNSECNTHFPIVDDIPILLNEKSSVFAIDDFISHRNTYRNLRENKFKRTLNRLIPKIGKNTKARENYEKLASLLLKQTTSPRVLVIGGSILGQGMESLVKKPSLELIESDVSFGPRTMLICDSHDIPFENGTFDGVVVQAVLEHVVDPYRCVEEMHRVLKKGGLIYAETAFMQQVHGGRYDFTRFTHLGHRRLFRRFNEIDSGAACGPGMALAWSYKSFLLSFTKSRTLRALIKVFTHLTSFYLKYFDYYLINKPDTLNVASSYYFMGRKGEHVLSDQTLITSYKGAA